MIGGEVMTIERYRELEESARHYRTEFPPPQDLALVREADLHTAVDWNELNEGEIGPLAE